MFPKWFSIFLMIFGILGVIASVTGIFYVCGFSLELSDSYNLSGTVNEEFNVVADTMDHASNNSANIAVSLTTMKNSIGKSSNLINRVANVIGKIGDVFYTDIPLIGSVLNPAANYFYSYEEDTREISTELAVLNKNLDNNINDFNMLSSDFGKMSIGMRGIGNKFSTLGVDVQSYDYTSIKIIAIGCLIYLIILHMTIILVGYFTLVNDGIE